jgi:hypothetical protein
MDYLNNTGSDYLGGLYQGGGAMGTQAVGGYAGPAMPGYMEEHGKSNSPAPPEAKPKRASMRIVPNEEDRARAAAAQAPMPAPVAANGIPAATPKWQKNLVMISLLVAAGYVGYKLFYEKAT